MALLTNVALGSVHYIVKDNVKHECFAPKTDLVNEMILSTVAYFPDVSDRQESCYLLFNFEAGQLILNTDPNDRTFKSKPNTPCNSDGILPERLCGSSPFITVHLKPDPLPKHYLLPKSYLLDKSISPEKNC
jgi:hypothetical protein